MASGKARGFKRSSATSSYSSATKIVLFVGLSVLGLWVLTSNSFAPHQSTTATRTPDQIISISRSHHPMPGGVHDDAIKSDDRGRSDDVIESLEMVDHERDSSADSSENADEKGTEQNDEQETKLENDGSEDGSGIKIDEKIDDQGGGEDHEDVKESKEEGQEKQTVLGTQNSEESSVTQKEEIERTAEENQTNDSQSTQNYEDGSEADGSEIAENQITDEDQQRRIDEHQQLEDEQIQQGAQEGQEKNPHGAISDNQIQHDEVPLQSPETGNNAQVKIQDIKHDSVKEVEKMNQETLSNRNDDASFSNGHSLGIPKESAESKKSWSTQAHQSQNQKERRKAGSDDKDRSDYGYIWLLCNVTAGADYIPCLDNEKAVKKLPNRKHDEHRERHCPAEPPTCLVPLPQGYKRRIDWPQSRDKIWYNNVPHTLLAEVKGHQNWVKVTGEFLTFPGGGTQFIHGAMHYINFIQEAVPDIAWGKHSRVVLDIGCGVASFGGYLFDKNVLTMSFAPKDEHEAQVQFALERGIPAISAVMGSQRLPFPSKVYDMVHCARCRVPWHAQMVKFHYIIFSFNNKFTFVI